MINKKIEILTPKSVTCIKGSYSLPIEVSLDWSPFETLVVTLEATTTSTGVDLSKTVPISFSLSKKTGLL